MPDRGAHGFIFFLRRGNRTYILGQSCCPNVDPGFRGKIGFQHPQTIAGDDNRIWAASSSETIFEVSVSILHVILGIIG